MTSKDHVLIAERGEIHCPNGQVITVCPSEDGVWVYFQDPTTRKISEAMSGGSQYNWAWKMDADIAAYLAGMLKSASDAVVSMNQEPDGV